MGQRGAAILTLGVAVLLHLPRTWLAEGPVVLGHLLMWETQECRRNGVWGHSIEEVFLKTKCPWLA